MAFEVDHSDYAYHRDWSVVAGGRAEVARGQTKLNHIGSLWELRPWANLPRFTLEARGANLALVDRVRTVAERKGATVGQVALAWLLAQKPSIVPIPGTHRLTRLDENVDAADVALTTEDLAELDEASIQVKIVGEALGVDAVVGRSVALVIVATGKAPWTTRRRPCAASEKPRRDPLGSWLRRCTPPRSAVRRPPDHRTAIVRNAL